MASPRSTWQRRSGRRWQKSDRERSAAAGFDQHIVKPVDVDRVIALALNV